MAACLAYLALGLARVAWLGRRAAPVDDNPAWRDGIEALRSRMGVRRPVSVRLSDRVAVPLAYGLRRPVILLPAEAEGWDAAQRRDVLMHELAHVARRDWPVQLASRLASALYWFHPLVWWSSRRLALEAERACDDRVLLAGSDSCGYAERLLVVASGGRQLPDPSYAAVALIRKSRRTDLATRIRSILDGRVRRHGLRALPAVLVAVALLVPLAALSTARLARAEAPAAEAGAEPSAEPRPEPSAEPNPEPSAEPDPESNSEPSPAPRASEGSSPLITAAFRGDLEEVRGLLDAGDDPNQVVNPADRGSDIQRSALGSAARAGHLEVAELLLDRGARVDLVPRGDASALITAAEHGHRPVVEMLLARGADPNRTLKGDGSPLIAAARSGDREVVRMLLDAGADPDTWVDGDESPLYHAVNGGHEEIVRMLLDAGVAPDAEMPGDGNALIVASRNGHLGVVRDLVGADADLERVVAGDENPLIQAAANGRLEVVRYLLDMGADQNVRVVIPPSEWRPEGEVRTALSMARRGGHRAVVELLEARGARE
jgi:ankyrin repeat protein